jgi:dihydroxyacetone kinase phosphotransfer subunit
VVGIVVVSHSPRLAEAAVELALEMVPGERPPIAVAAGAGEGVIGTDATKVAAAIQEVASADGVLVLMDLGSAVLSAELALELLGEQPGEVRLSSAPLVEGLLAAVVRAANGAGLDEVEAEARGALAPKASQLREPETTRASDAALGGSTADSAPVATERRERFVLRNAEGMHTRPASLFVNALAGLDATVRVTAHGKPPVDGRSPMGLLLLAARQGDEIEVTATGPDAERALAAIRELVARDFGE